MRMEFIDKVKAKEILARSILTSEGGILLRAGISLTEQYIKKLKSLGVFYVYLEDERLDDIPIEDARLTVLKQAAMKNMCKITKNVYLSNKKGTKESLSIVEDLVHCIMEIKDVSNSLHDVHTYDNYTYVHSLDTCIMSTFLGVTLKLDEGNLKELGIGGMLHDIGKLQIANSIITKQGKLTPKEYEEIKKHPIYGEAMLKRNLAISDNILKVILQHHERVDGTGYPFRLKREQISKFAKIVSVCDIYDAVSNDRCYRKKFSPNDAYELILAGTGTSFDEEIVIKFKESFAVYPLGCCLKLSDGTEGYVIRQNTNFPDRPIIRVLYDKVTREPIPFYEIDLLKALKLGIKEIV